MARIIRTIDKSQGHCWPASLPDASKLVGATVLVNDLAALKVGDVYLDHTGCTSPPTTHVAPTAAGGSPDVFIEGMPVHRDGDRISCGDAADNGSNNVFANGAGRTGVPGGPAVGAFETVGYTVKVPEFTYPNMKGDEIIIKIPIPVAGSRSMAVGSTCTFSLPLLEAYSPLEEEDTGTIVKNFPGPALTVQSGQNTVTLPGRPELNTAIPISTKFRSLKWVSFPVAENLFTLKVNFNESTGVFNGSLKVASNTFFNNGFEGRTYYEGKVDFINFVGTTTKTVIFEGQEVASCP